MRRMPLRSVEDVFYLWLKYSIAGQFRGSRCKCCLHWGMRADIDMCVVSDKGMIRHQTVLIKSDVTWCSFGCCDSDVRSRA